MSSYKYISKDPCGEDLFAGKVHERTADHIASLLRTEGSLIIGIDGGWGAGKSNLIQMVEKKADGQAIFFTYDAWGHQNDMPRRSILEELTSKITRSNALSKKDKTEWEDKLNLLMSQRREISTETIPKLSTGIILLSLVMILTPIFSSIAESLSSSVWRWKIAIISLPVIIILFYSLYRFFRLKERNFETLLSEFVCLYQERTRRESSYETVFSKEPSSTQFKQWMNELDASLQSPLILVFDNMDRLPTSKVQEFWAAIHSFFSEVKYERIKVIIPFDRKHIISAFKDENSEDNRSYGNDFIDKTFDIVYRIAPPTLSNWKGYFSSQWQTAFGVQLSSEHSIKQIYDLLTESKTPREIIAFINECVTIRKTCGESIPDEYVALFVVGKHKISDSPQKELLELTFLEALAYKYRNEETSKYLSALYYQLSPDETLDIVYADQLRRELEKGETTLLQSLVTQSVFSDLLEHVIVDVSNVEGTALAFAKVEEVAPIKPIFWNQLVSKASEEEENPKQYQIDLLKHASEDHSKKYLQKIVQSLYFQCGYINESSSRPGGFNAPQFYQSIKSIEDKLTEYNYLNPLSLLHNVKTAPKLFVLFVQLAKDSYSKYKIECSISNLDSYLESLSVEIQNYLEMGGAVNYLPEDTRKSLSLYQGALKEKISNTRSIEVAEILLCRWVELGIMEKELMDDESISYLLNSANEGTLLYYCLICMRFSRGGSFSSYSNRIPEDGDEELLENLARYINLFATYTELLLMCQDMTDYPLYGKLLRYLVSNNLGNGLLVHEVLPRYREISRTLNIRVDHLLKDWDRMGVENSVIEETIPSLPVDFFEETSEMKNLKIVSRCHLVAERYLQSILCSDWENFLTEESQEYQLLMCLRCDCPNAFEAFKRVVETEFECQELKLHDEIYSRLVALFESQGQTWGSTFQNVRNMYGTSGRNITKELFVRYGKELFESADLSENQDAIRTILPTNLLIEEETRNILIEKRSDVAQILNSTEDKYREEFERVALSVYNSLDGESKESMKVLLFELGIPLSLNGEKE